MTRFVPTLCIATIAFAALASSCLASAGPGPWANATYYQGNLDGKYQAAVYGTNISGVLGFALKDGSPTIVTNSVLNTTNNSSQSTIIVDPFQNYFVIFVEGRTYSGVSTANVNYDSSTVTGALIGTQPDVSFITNSNSILSVTAQQFTNTFATNSVSTNVTVTNINGKSVTNQITTTNWFTNTIVETLYITNTNSLSSLVMEPSALVNRGLNGGFEAQISGSGAVFTFAGDGELSTPAQLQTVNYTTNERGEVVGAQIDTDTVPFGLNGIRVSFSTATGSAGGSAGN